MILTFGLVKRGGLQEGTIYPMVSKMVDFLSAWNNQCILDVYHYRELLAILRATRAYFMDLASMNVHFQKEL